MTNLILAKTQSYPARLPFILEQVYNQTETLNMHINQFYFILLFNFFMAGQIAEATAQPLPFGKGSELLSFESNINGCQVELIWETGKEINLSHFTVERSFDKIDFEKVHASAAANSKNGHSYYYMDKPEAQTAYYRLKITKYDGTSEYSQIIVANTKCIEEQFTLFPNPVAANEILTLKITSAKQEKVKGVITDEQNNALMDLNLLLDEGDNFIRLRVSEFGAGVFYVKLDGDRSALRLVIPAGQ